MALKLSLWFIGLVSLFEIAVAQSGAYGQCGGIDWAGPTTCIPGYTCMDWNPWYFQCIPAATTITPTSSPTSILVPASTPTSSSTSSGPVPLSTGLHIAAKAAGKKYFGTATDNPELTDVPYVAQLGNIADFGQITSGNSMKWDATEPERGTFTFAGGDVIAQLAQNNSQLLRGHNCVWYNQLPSWVTSGNFDNATLQSIVTTHCSTLVSHYKGQIWDVVNEPFNDDGTWRSTVFYNTIGTGYVALALNAARAADPNAKLYINEYNLEYNGAKTTTMYNLVQSLQASGTPIDGIGIQGHLIVGQVPSAIQTVIELYTSLGVEVAITELDIRMTLPATDALLAQQQADYETVISACNAVPGCVGVTVWDWTDKYSWVPSTFSGQGAACPWDANLVKKPAYNGIIAGFQT